MLPFFHALASKGQKKSSPVTEWLRSCRCPCSCSCSSPSHANAHVHVHVVHTVAPVFLREFRVVFFGGNFMSMFMYCGAHCSTGIPAGIPYSIFRNSAVFCRSKNQFWNILTFAELENSHPWTHNFSPSPLFFAKRPCTSLSPRQISWCAFIKSHGI